MKFDYTKEERIQAPEKGRVRDRVGGERRERGKREVWKERRDID